MRHLSVNEVLGSIRQGLRHLSVQSAVSLTIKGRDPLRVGWRLGATTVYVAIIDYHQ